MPQPIRKRWLRNKIVSNYSLNMISLDPASYTIYVGRHAGWFENAGSQVQTFDGRNGGEMSAVL